MNSGRTKTYIFVALLIVLAVIAYRAYGPDDSSSTGVFAADGKFQPLDVQAPQLRLDLLDRIHKLEYGGTHRNIFVAAPPPPPASSRPAAASKPFIGPKLPPPPPPVRVPAELFGYAVQRDSGRREAFFVDGDDVLVVGEGETFMNRFRLVHVGEDSADVEEISTGRHAAVPMTAPSESSAPATP
jgi:hypothetical protein